MSQSDHTLPPGPWSDGPPQGRPEASERPYGATPATWLAIAVAASLTTFILDVLTPANFIMAILYGGVLLLAAFARRRRWIWIMLVVLLAGNGLAGLLAARPERPGLVYGVPAWVVNRVVAAIALFPMAILLDQLIRVQQQVRQQARSLSQRNAALEQANREIATREEQIFRQNEELQAQTEELERQSEELRVTNDELARREKMLERLLDLSRSLVAETTQLTENDVMTRLCEALAQLADADAAAFVVRDGGDMLVRVCHGAGPQGLALNRIPFEDSFAGLVMSRLQSGYLEDIAQRPDLRLPEPAAGPHFRSVLATPLKVRGRLLGALELYSAAPRAWTGEQIALVESIGAQASVSLEAVELFAAVQQERVKFETVFRTLPMPVFVAEDPQCQRVRVNPAASVMLGVPTESNISPFAREGRRSRVQFFREGQAISDLHRPLVRSVLHGEQIINEEYEVLLPANDRRVLLVSAAPIYSARGEIVGGVAVAADVTLMKRLQQELEGRRREAEEASVRKTRFLAAISHDIRTPVNAISLTAELIRRAAASPAMAGDLPAMAQDLQTNARSLGVLVHDLLDVARFDTGKIEFQESEFSLGQLIADESRQLLPLAQEKGLALITEGAGAGIWLRADRVKLGRVLANLIGNAIKFTEHGSICVSTTLLAGDGLAIRVSDTGVGISPADQERIFDEFTQLRNPERDRVKGTGLGLAISRRLVEAMGGIIGVTSEPGRGSTFTVTLPASALTPTAGSLLAAPAPSAALPVPSHDGHPGGTAPLAGRRLLLVEDHPTTRRATSQILSAEGAAVAEAPDGQTALALLDKGGFDAVLLDMMLPDMDGTEILRRLQANRPETLKAAIVLTGDYTPERIERVRAVGADAVVSKPIDIPKLVATLQAICARV